MARKSKVVKEQLEKLKKQEEEISKLMELAETEEKNQLENTEKAVQTIVEKNNLFCGVILSHDDLLSVLRLALQTGENVKIPFRLYFNE